MSNSANWYLATLAFRGARPSSPHWLRRCYCLIQAAKDVPAYDKATFLGTELLGSWPKPRSSRMKFIAVEDLVLITDEPSDGAEILWVESEMTHSELMNRLNLHAHFEPRKDSTSGWFVATILLYEVVLDVPNDRHLVWMNSHLIKASDSIVAYDKALRLGEACQRVGEHTSDLRPANWKFGVVQQLRPTIFPPADKSLLWYRDLPAKDSTFDRLSSLKKEDLSVFHWRLEHRTGV